MIGKYVSTYIHKIMYIGILTDLVSYLNFTSAYPSIVPLLQSTVRAPFTGANTISSAPIQQGTSHTVNSSTKGKQIIEIHTYVANCSGLYVQSLKVRSLKFVPQLCKHNFKYVLKRYKK